MVEEEVKSPFTGNIHPVIMRLQATGLETLTRENSDVQLVQEVLFQFLPGKVLFRVFAGLRLLLSVARKALLLHHSGPGSWEGWEIQLIERGRASVRPHSFEQARNDSV
jgi:hypothetical protein